MNSYRDFEVEDFVCDDSFIEWVLNPQKENSDFWDKWQRENPDKVTRLQNARAILTAIRVKDNNKHLTEDDISDIVNYVNKHATGMPEAEVVQMPRRSYTWLKVAASIVVLFTLAIGYRYIISNVNKKADNVTALPAPFETNLTRIKNQSKESLVVELSDGSVVVLSPNSNLAYPKHFSAPTREVTLEGKGFFEVRKNPNKPFFVHTKYLTTKVLGTSFIVNAAENQVSTVVVITGKVMVNRTDDQQESNWITLTPNTQVAYAPSTEKIKTDTVVNHPTLSADVAYNAFVFKETPFFNIIQKLEEAYHITIDYNNDKYGKTSVTGDISKLSLDEKIKFICKAVNANYQIEAGRIRIY
ncbi:FecR family protein [Mucilaginibacter calamicampi]|uniref:FecR family protein n=1 Tax=Mucilaginibacter calamicampi TaxID=1302352 RepID=A0ABW2Z187_9SPHI